jgi:hypothetical protein
VGLTAIFAAAVIPIVIMGTILEAAKLVVTVWLHEYWQEVKLTMKIYLVPAVFILMVITSMGIFGFLSKAHTDQALVSGDASARLSIVDEKIRIERENIANARAVIQQMDAAVTGVIATGDQEIKLRDGSTQIRSAAERSLQIRRSQARDRAALTQQIEEAQTRIVRLQEESAPLRAEFRKVEAEVGPIKYIAALIYGDNPDANLLEKAVRWVIIILVIVFDPLAIMMLLAFTESLRWERQKRAAQPPPEEKVNDISPASEPPTAPVMAGPPQQEPDPGPNPDQPPDSDQVDAGQPDPGDNIPVRPDGPDADQPEPDHRPARVDAEFIEEFHEPDWPERPGDYRDPPTTVDPDDEEDDDLPSVVRQAMRLWKLDHPGMTLKEQRRLLAAGMLDHEPWLDYLDDARIKREPGFGDMLPDSAYKGDMFVITSVQPTSLFKYNGEKWISIDKDFTDQYAYNDAYIDYLINQISSGAYDADLLSEAERSQIAQRLKREI